MQWTVENFVNVRESVEQLLEELQLADYRFNVEPRDDEWEVQVECRSREGWHTTTFRLTQRTVAPGARTRETPRKLRDYLIEQLGDCTRSSRRSRERRDERAREQASERAAEQGIADAERAAPSELGALSEYSASSSGMLSTERPVRERDSRENPMSDADSLAASPAELRWYALGEATQDPLLPDRELESAEESAIQPIPLAATGEANERENKPQARARARE